MAAIYKHHLATHWKVTLHYGSWPFHYYYGCPTFVSDCISLEGLGYGWLLDYSLPRTLMKSYKMSHNFTKTLERSYLNFACFQNNQLSNQFKSPILSKKKRGEGLHMPPHSWGTAHSQDEKQNDIGVPIL